MIHLRSSPVGVHHRAQAYVRWAIGQDLWPFDSSLRSVNEEWLFSAIEFLHDHCAEPTDSTYHSFAECGVHVQDADTALGQALFRQQMNRYLSAYGNGYELRDNGEVWASTPGGLGDLTPVTTGDEDFDGRVAHAQSAFRRRGATNEEKRDAITNLAAILENARDNAGTGLPSDAEKRLFEIANQFGIRHHNPTQQTDYDSEPWLDWIFYSFLNAIALMARLDQRGEVEDSD